MTCVPQCTVTRDPIGKRWISVYMVSVRFVPEGKGSWTRRGRVIVSPPRYRLIGRYRDFVDSLGWNDLKRDLRDFTSRHPRGEDIGLQWFSIMSNGTRTLEKTRRECLRCSTLGQDIVFNKKGIHTMNGNISQFYVPRKNLNYFEIKSPRVRVSTKWNFVTR